MLAPQDGPFLLTLKRTDAKEVDAANVDNDTEGPLVLLQMPPTLSVSDLMSAKIIATDTRQACLVVEQSGKTFEVCRVESSNAMILVPPQLSKTKTTTTTTTTDANAPPSKRLKTTGTGDLNPIKAQLPNPDGSGASFLELKERTLNRKELSQLLKHCLFDPYDGAASKVEWSGRTLSELALELQCSEKEVSNRLQEMKAFGMPQKDEQMGYGLLSEEAIQEAHNGIVATLIECDTFADYVEKGVVVDLFVMEVMKRMESIEIYPQAKYIVKHCLKLLAPEKGTETETGCALLDFEKVALCVAHSIFQKQSKPWEELEFRSAWQNDLPGAVEAPSMDLLRGVAKISGVERLWKYFPEHKLSLSPQKRFAELFAEQERWTELEVEPYLKRLTQESENLIELLLRFAHVVTENVEGVPTRIYMDPTVKNISLV